MVGERSGWLLYYLARNNKSRVWRAEMINVTESQMQIILRILDRYVPDSQVWAFGSRVKGNFKSYSDLDLVVISEDKMSITEFGELIEAFQESDLPFRVDVLDWHAISPEFRQVIKRKYEVLKVKKNNLAMVTTGFKDWTEK